jgi:hypothetical protein
VRGHNGQPFNPLAFLGDFSEALCNGCKSACIGADYLGDLYHFLHDNIAWLQRRGGPQTEERKANDKLLRQMLKILFWSPEKAAFDQNLSRFMRTFTFFVFVPYN